MEKKETMEGSGCTREKPLQAHYSTGWTLARALQGWPEPKERRPCERLSCFAYDGLNFKQMK
jgi:hypothetical protein